MIRFIMRMTSSHLCRDLLVTWGNKWLPRTRENNLPRHWRCLLSAWCVSKKSVYLGPQFYHRFLVYRLGRVRTSFSTLRTCLIANVHTSICAVFQLLLFVECFLVFGATCVKTDCLHLCFLLSLFPVLLKTSFNHGTQIQVDLLRHPWPSWAPAHHVPLR